MNPKLGEPIFQSLKDGLRFVFNTKAILGALTLDMIAVLFGGAVALLPIYAQDILNVGAEGFGILRAAPAVGASIVWIPVAVYLIATGAIGKGLILMAFGAGVIGLVDNLLRPYLVGKDTALPDYVVLLSTLGGIALLRLNGLVVGPLIAALFIAVWDIAARAEGDEDKAAQSAPEGAHTAPEDEA